MPRLVRAYGCGFRCGQRVVISQRAMAEHEGRCIKNPASRACPTCAHNYAERSDYGYDPRRLYNCDLDLLGDGVTMNSKCDRWQPTAEATP